jgi:hypothetical protein
MRKLLLAAVIIIMVIAATKVNTDIIKANLTILELKAGLIKWEIQSIPAKMLEWKLDVENKIMDYRLRK